MTSPRVVSGAEPDGGHLEELRRDPIALMRRVRAECGDVGSFDLAGRPVVLRYSMKDIQRAFKRI